MEIPLVDKFDLKIEIMVIYIAVTLFNILNICGSAQWPYLAHFTLELSLLGLFLMTGL